jgi:hypothetical protein
MGGRDSISKGDVDDQIDNGKNGLVTSGSRRRR